MIYYSFYEDENENNIGKFLILKELEHKLQVKDLKNNVTFLYDKEHFSKYFFTSVKELINWKLNLLIEDEKFYELKIKKIKEDIEKARNFLASNKKEYWVWFKQGDEINGIPTYHNDVVKCAQDALSSCLSSKVFIRDAEGELYIFSKEGERIILNNN